jgi:hypothetical protein
MRSRSLFLLVSVVVMGVLAQHDQEDDNTLLSSILNNHADFNKQTQHVKTMKGGRVESANMN